MGNTIFQEPTPIRTTGKRSFVSIIRSTISSSYLPPLIYDSSNQAAPTVAWSGNTYPTIGSLNAVPSWAGVFHATYNIRPNLLNEAAFDENGNNILLTNTGKWHTPSGFTTTPLFPNANGIN